MRMSTNSMVGTQLNTSSQGGQLRIDMTIDTYSSYHCPVINYDHDVQDVTINAAGKRCVADLHSAEHATIIRKVGSGDSTGVCQVFAEFDVVPHVKGVDNGTLHIQAFLDDRAVIRNLIRTIESDIGTVTVKAIASQEAHTQPEIALIDLRLLTGKQREALELAVNEGYFEGDARLTDLATILDISPSAVSQRLRAGQKKLLDALFFEVSSS